MSAPLLSDPIEKTNGAGAAAVLAGGLGSFYLGALALAADASPALNKALSFYKPTGALSGVSSLAILLWVISWVALDRVWRKRTLPLLPVTIAAFLLLGASLFLTFPPFMDWVQGK